LKRIKNTDYSLSIQVHQFFIAVLKKMLCGIPCRLILRISFLILPILSYGKGLNMEANALSILGLENVYTVQQQKIEPYPFAASNAVFTKSIETIFVLNGAIQMDSLFVTPSDFIHFATILPKETQYKTNFVAKAATTEEQKNSYQAALSASPWKKNLLHQETFFASVVVVSVLITPERNKKNNKQFQLNQSCTDLLLWIVGKTRRYSLYSTCSVTATFGKNSKDFAAGHHRQRINSKFQSQSFTIGSYKMEDEG
jgi:hypothetical protein